MKKLIFATFLVAAIAFISFNLTNLKNSVAAEEEELNWKVEEGVQSKQQTTVRTPAERADKMLLNFYRRLADELAKELEEVTGDQTLTNDLATEILSTADIDDYEQVTAGKKKKKGGGGDGVDICKYCKRISDGQGCTKAVAQLCEKKNCPCTKMKEAEVDMQEIPGM